MELYFGATLRFATIRTSKGSSNFETVPIGLRHALRTKTRPKKYSGSHRSVSHDERGREGLEVGQVPHADLPKTRE